MVFRCAATVGTNPAKPIARKNIQHMIAAHLTGARAGTSYDRVGRRSTVASRDMNVPPFVSSVQEHRRVCRNGYRTGRTAGKRVSRSTLWIPEYACVEPRGRGRRGGGAAPSRASGTAGGPTRESGRAPGHRAVGTLGDGVVSATGSAYDRKS